MSGAAAEVTHDDILGMSDDQFGDMDTAFLDMPDTADEDGEEIPRGDSSEAATAAELSSQDEEDFQDEELPDPSYEDASEEEGSDSESATADEDEDSSSEETDEEEGSDTDPNDTDDDEADDKDESADVFKDFVKQIKAPFKANGKTMQIESAEDAVRLMQMGANYNRKMAGMKPHLKLLKTLEKNDISEEQLSYLIDIKNKNPEAIAKLLKDSEIDPLEFDAKPENYKVTNHTVSDAEVAMDEVLDDIKGSETFSKTLDVVAGKWDDASKTAVRAQPELLRVIDGHMASGVYDLITTSIEQERMLGRINGLSDIEAYQKVGDAISAAGGFDHLFEQEGQQTEPAPQENRSPAPEVKADKRREKRKAASPTRSKPGPASAPDYNPLGLSDDEFLKIDERYI